MGRSFYLAILGVLLVLGGSADAWSDVLVASSGRARVQLIELYSSESCSSCPPADAWISTLQGQSGLWKKFVPIVFHVDYWNHLGWKDRFSSSEMTDRQAALSRLWAVPSVYTPAVIVDGQEWRDWRSPGELDLPSSPGTSIELSIFKTDNDSIRVKVSGISNRKRYVVHVARLGMGLSTDVSGGENSGRLLKHNFLVLDWEGKGVNQSGSELTFSFKGSTKTAPRFAIVAWIEEAGNPTPLQSTGGYL
jgi:hypothetical protein